MRWARLLFATGALLALAACGGSDDGPAVQTAPLANTRSAPVSVYLLRENRVAPARRFVRAVGSRPLQAVRALVVGPSTEERAGGLQSAVPRDTKVDAVRVADGLALVSLSREFGSPQDEDFEARAAQVVYTLTQFNAVEWVTFYVGGQVVGVPTPVGRLAARPDRGVLDTWAPAILVEAPAASERVRSPLRVEGTTCVFSGAVSLELRDSDDRRLAGTTVIAPVERGERTTFETTLRFTVEEPGEGRLVAWERPPGGERQNVVEVPVWLGG